MKKLPPPILLEIVRGNCQWDLVYTGQFETEIIDGQKVRVFDGEDIADFVVSNIPSLRNKEFKVRFAERRK